MQKYIIKDEITYYDLIYWISSQAMDKSVGIAGKGDLLQYFIEELLKLEHLHLSIDDALIDNYNNHDTYLLLIDTNKGEMEVYALTEPVDPINIVCLMEDCMESLPKFYKSNEEDIYICCYGEDE